MSVPVKTEGRCAVPGCQTPCGAGLLMCGWHWHQVPHGIREQISRHRRASEWYPMRRACSDAVKAVRKQGKGRVAA